MRLLLTIPNNRRHTYDPKEVAMKRQPATITLVRYLKPYNAATLAIVLASLLAIVPQLLQAQPVPPIGVNSSVVNPLQVALLHWYDADLTTKFGVGVSPYHAAFDGASMWITNPGSGTITKLRASDGSTLGTFAVGTSPFGIAFDGANLWVANYGSNNVMKVRASDGAILGTFSVSNNPFGVVFDGANIWVSHFQSNSVSKLRASDGSLLGMFTVGQNPADMAFDGLNVWVANQGDRKSVV